MIYRARTVTLLAAKAPAYRAVVVRAAAYLSEHYPAVHVEIWENVAGPQHQIHMVTRCNSLAALETYEAERKDDAGWLALIEEARVLQGALDTVDHLYRVIS